MREDSGRQDYESRRKGRENAKDITLGTELESTALPQRLLHFSAPNTGVPMWVLGNW